MTKMISAEDFFTQIKQQYTQGLPFVAYRKPVSENVVTPEGPGIIKALLQKDAELHVVKDFSEKGFVFSPFDTKEQTILIPYSETEKLFSRLPGKKGDERETNKEEPVDKDNSTEREKHIALVKKGVEAIRKGKLKKVVLSREEEVPVRGKDPVSVFQRLLESYETAFCYIWYHPQIGLWLGATPETLLYINGCVLRTMALAGTQKFSGTTKVNWGEKERQEQQVVTDSIVDSLRFQVKSLKISAAGTHRAGNLLHIKTDIQATLIPEYKTKNIAPLLHSLHPTPAVCGFPKEEARRFIRENEGYDRSFYAGFLGELNADVESNSVSGTGNRDSALYVNLRCMQIKDTMASLYIGGGITRDSVPESEWEETVHKSYTMKRILG
ncbi:chorismate-binding protein [Sinomicrobium sp. M5D2P9]